VLSDTPGGSVDFLGDGVGARFFTDFLLDSGLTIEGLVERNRDGVCDDDESENMPICRSVSKSLVDKEGKDLSTDVSIGINSVDIDELSRMGEHARASF
jgi:hypothetical protein